MGNSSDTVDAGVGKMLNYLQTRLDTAFIVNNQTIFPFITDLDLGGSNATFYWDRYAASCSPIYCDYNEEKAAYNYYLQIIALIWGVFSSGRAALMVLWVFGAWLAMRLCQSGGGDANDIQKSLIEPELLKWSIPKVQTVRNQSIKSRKFRIRGSSKIWWLQLNSTPDPAQDYQLSLQVNIGAFETSHKKSPKQESQARQQNDAETCEQYSTL